jgi:dTDP-D-glucose 4,6-dehydratase
LRSLAGEAFGVEGDGLQVRTFLPVCDLVAAAILVAKKGARNAAYNIAGRETLSVIEVGHLIAKTTGRNASIVSVADRQVNDRAYMIDCSRLGRSAIGRAAIWKPKSGPSRPICAVLAGPKFRHPALCPRLPTLRTTR